MPFEAKRVRVRFPCHDDSMVVISPNGWGELVSPRLKAPLYTPILLCLWHSKPIHCPNWSCGDLASIFGPVGPEDPIAGFHIEQLPVLRRQLELQMAQIDAIAAQRGEIESQLEKLDAVGRELEKSDLEG